MICKHTIDKSIRIFIFISLLFLTTNNLCAATTQNDKHDLSHYDLQKMLTEQDEKTRKKASEDVTRLLETYKRITTAPFPKIAAVVEAYNFYKEKEKNKAIEVEKVKQITENVKKRMKAQGFKPYNSSSTTSKPAQNESTQQPNLTKETIKNHYVGKCLGALGSALIIRAYYIKKINAFNNTIKKLENSELPQKDKIIKLRRLSTFWRKFGIHKINDVLHLALATTPIIIGNAFDRSNTK